LEALLEESIKQYLQTYYPCVPQTDTDPLIGLYEGLPETSIRAEGILETEISEESGLSRKD
jgi:hypothetical protein